MAFEYRSLIGGTAVDLIEWTAVLVTVAALLAAAPLGRLLGRQKRDAIDKLDLALIAAILAFVGGVGYGGIAAVVMAPAGVLAAGALMLAERRRVEDSRRLAESEANFRLIAEMASDVIVRRTIEGKRLYV